MTDILATAATAAETIAFGDGAGAHALPQLAPESPAARAGYDRAVDAVNRLPRPLAALLALAMFLDAAIDPQGFAQRMQALSSIPEPLWWLLGGVVTFFFGARETHYLRLSRDLTGDVGGAPKP